MQQKFLSLVIAGSTIVGSQFAMAGGKNRQQAPQPEPTATATGKATKPAEAPKAKVAKEVNCSDSKEYCVKVRLSNVQNTKGTLQIYHNTANGWVKQGSQYAAIGGLGNHPDGQRSIKTPAGVREIYKQEPHLWYNGAYESNFNDASYFYNPNFLDSKGNQVAVHTAPNYGTNSHGCVRSPGAPAVYALPKATTQVDVDYI